MNSADDRPWLTATAAGPDWRTQMTWKNHTFFADEPASAGGQDTAPSPGVLLLASLASCTVITLQMYAARKGVDLSGLQVDVRYTSDVQGGSRKTRFEKRITLPDGLDEPMRQRLLQVSEACPVSKILNGEIETSTEAV